jgi:alpha-tubulin suppressor-like RCC1 family protein
MGAVRPVAIVLVLPLIACGRIGFGSDYGVSGNAHGLVSVGDQHACAVRAGSVLCWGVGSSGQLGNGVFDAQFTPVVVGLVSNAVRVAAGYRHSCAITESGDVYCWGNNDDLQLGGVIPSMNVIRPGSEYPDAVVVHGLPGPAVDIAAGSYHTCAVIDDGTVWCWGYDDHGQLGDNAPMAMGKPPAMVGGADDVVEIALGGHTSCARRSDGSVLCWGINDAGQLGDGTQNDRATPGLVPNLVASAITASGGHTCAIVDGGHYTCWGNNYNGQLGDGSSEQHLMVTGESFGDDYVAIDAGDSYTCAVRTNGTMGCWGNNSDGRLGDGTQTFRSAPVAVSGVTDMRNVSAGSQSTCAIRADGAVLCWGYGSFGQIGDGRGARSTPMRVVNVTSSRVVSGNYHACAIDGSNPVKCWGLGDDGQLGDGAGVSRSTPTSVTKTWGTGHSVLTMALGQYHTCAVLDDASVWCWGYNAYGQLGDGTTTSTKIPVAVTGLGPAAWVAAGDYFSCAALVDGTVWCWGQDGSGQLGDGGSTDRPVPVQVPSVSSVDKVVAGSHFACAHITVSSNNVWCWGENDHGQLGIGTTANSPPTNLAFTATEVQAGNIHACAIDGAGALWCWGFNGQGQFGIATPSGDQPTPFATSIGPVTQLALGDGQTCAIVGSVAECWGDGGWGELGDGMFMGRMMPMPITLAGTPTTLAAGNVHSCAGLASNEIYCWGDDDVGQLGIGIESRALVPAVVAFP